MPGCQTHRLLPGRDEAGSAICRDCAGITRSFYCARCGFEGKRHASGLCTRCTLTDVIAAVFDDGTGRIAPALRPLASKLAASPNPKSTWMWLRRRHVRELVSELAAGVIPLTHEALHALPNWRTVAHLRDLLMASNILPVVDKQLLHFETWLHLQLTELDGHPDERILRKFSTWHQLPKLRAKATVTPLTEGARHFAAQQFTQARRFLGWLRQREHDIAGVSQADIDAWHAGARTLNDKRTLRGFLIWAIETRHMPSRDLPGIPIVRAQPLTQHRRLALLRRALTVDGPLRSRVAACLMLLYAQPASRIVRLTIDDIIESDDGEVLIRLGDPPTPVPEPFASLLLQAIAERENLNTATNPGARWLFPGRRAGQPFNSRALAENVRDLGIPGLAGRTAALRQLVLQAPAPVVAQSLGFHDKTTTRVTAEAGGTWTHYAAGDHEQRRS